MRNSNLPISLFCPRVGVVVVAALLPETGVVALHEFEAVKPFGAFIEVEFWHDETYRTAVFHFQVCAIVLDGDHYIVVVEIGERKIGGVACPGMRHDEFRSG